MKNNCLICQKPLLYYPEAQEMTCAFCGKTFLSNAACEDGHFICDHCHAEKGLAVIRKYCENSTSTDPVALLAEIMQKDFIYLHGPEHHTMVASVLLAACHNSGADFDLPAALSEAENRGKQVPGGFCGFQGCCGAAVGLGIFVSIYTAADPLSGKEWALANLATSEALSAIAKLGGPRCCKRNSMTAVLTGIRFVKEHFGIELTKPSRILCGFSEENNECKKEQCPYFDKKRSE